MKHLAHLLASIPLLLPQLTHAAPEPAPDDPTQSLLAWLAVALGVVLVAGIAGWLRKLYSRLRLRIARAEELTTRLLEITHQPVVLSNPHTLEILDVNPAAVALAGRPREQLLGRNLLEVIPPDDALLGLQLLADWDTGPRPETFHQVTGPDGEDHFLVASKTRLEARDATLTIVRDITDYIRRLDVTRRHKETFEILASERTRRLEEANQRLQDVQRRLIDAQRLSIIEELTGALSHTVFNPLQALLGTIQLHVEAQPEPDPVLDRIFELAQRIGRVVNSTLALARRRSLKLRREDPTEILRTLADSIALRAQEQSVRVSVTCGDELPELRTDRDLLLSALTSVTDNALEAMPSGGELSLAVECVPGVPAVRYLIQDSGPGIPDELRERCVQPFFTTKGGGAGLGLAIAHGIIQGHRGSLRIDPAPPVGTLVCIELEATPRPLRSPPVCSGAADASTVHP